MRGSIKSKTASLELRIEAAEMLTTRPAVSDETLRAFEHAARVLACFACEFTRPSPEAVLHCLLQSGMPEVEAKRFASMSYSQAHDEVMNITL